MVVSRICVYLFFSQVIYFLKISPLNPPYEPTRALLRLERTMNLLEGGKGGEGRMGERGWEGTEGGWGERVGRGRGGEREGAHAKSVARDR